LAIEPIAIDVIYDLGSNVGDFFHLNSLLNYDSFKINEDANTESTKTIMFEEGVIIAIIVSEIKVPISRIQHLSQMLNKMSYYNKIFDVNKI